jgi:hypothetical protein
MKALRPLLFLLLLFACGRLLGQTAGLPYNWKPVKPVYRQGDASFFMPDTLPNKRRLRWVNATTLGGYGLAYTGIALSWYKDFPRTRFHFFDDNHEWAQVDKMGHFVGGYQGTRGMIALFKWAGLPKGRSALYGSLIGFGTMLPMELLDGFASKWGASWGDIVADFGGAALAYGNEMLWEEQVIQNKVSYHPTPYADARPDLFGDTYSRYLKDYNGHTGWLSFRVHHFLPEGKFKEHYPRWLNLAVGYGANGLLGGYDGGLSPAIRAREYRQYYLALDIDLSQIKTRSGALSLLFDIINVVHLPAPTLEFNGKHGLRWHWLYM